MIASWMLYALLVSVLLAAGAWLLEGAVRLRGGPVRYLWLGALVATVALTALAPLRRAPASLLPSVTLARTQGADDEAVVRAEGPAAFAARALRAARAALARPLNGAAAVGTGAAGRRWRADGWRSPRPSSPSRP